MTQLPRNSQHDMDIVVRAVNMWFWDEDTSAEIAKKLDLAEKTVRNWLRNHDEGPKEIKNHAHRWILESPAGRPSLGYCKECRSTKYFMNSSDHNHTWVKRQEKARLGSLKGANSRWRNHAKT